VELRTSAIDLSRLLQRSKVFGMPKQGGLTRRNGLLQACEECRKAKGRCGHEIPTCHRCARRRITCIYDPAPMSRQPRSRLAVNAGVTSQNPDLEQESQILEPLSQSLSSGQSPLSDIPASYPRSSLFKKSVIGYVSTQFNAVFLKNQEQFCFDSILSPAVGESVETDTSFVHNKPPSSSINDNKIQLGIDILRRFPTVRTQQALMDFLDHYPDPWISPKMIRHCLSSTCFDLQHSRTAGTLTKVSSEMCAIGETPIHLEGVDEWYNWFSGSKLRWEMTGILFTIFGMAFYSRQECDPVFNLPEQGGRNRKTAATLMRVTASECLQMCRETDINDMIVVLTKNIGRLESVIIGDASWFP